MGFAADFGRANVPQTISQGMAPLETIERLKAAKQTNDLGAIQLQEAKQKQEQANKYIDMTRHPALQLNPGAKELLGKTVDFSRLRGRRADVYAYVGDLTQTQKLTSDTLKSVAEQNYAEDEAELRKLSKQLENLMATPGNEEKIAKIKGLMGVVSTRSAKSQENLAIIAQQVVLGQKKMQQEHENAIALKQVKDADEQVEKDTWGQAQKGFDAEGDPIVYVTNKKGEMKVLEGVKPNFGKSTRVYDKEGNLIFESGDTTGAKEVGTIPPGYQAIYDDNDKIVSMKPVKGGPAEREIEKEASDKAIGTEVKQKAAQTVYEDTERALKVIDKWGRGASGVGGITDRIPEVPAHQLRQHIESIKGNVGIDSLIRIKESGAGLGHIPQAQLEMLAALLGRLDTKTTPEDLKYNLKRIQELYAEIVESSGGDPKQVYADRLRRLSGTTKSGGSYTIKQTGE